MQYNYKPLDYRNPPPVKEILFNPDPRWFMEAFLKIPTQSGSRPFDLFPWMEDTASDTITTREIMLKSREIGSSTFWVAYFLREVLTHEGANLIIVANKEGNAVNLVSYARHMVYNLPPQLRPVIGKDNEQLITFPKLGNQIKAIPGTPDACRSERAKYLLCTEMAFWERPDELWSAAQGTLVQGGHIVIESTANTESDIFHDMYFDPLNGFKKRFYGWDANPTHDLKWYQERKIAIKEPHLFYREYPSSPSEAFQSAGDIYFHQDDLARGQEYVKTPLQTLPVGRGDITLGYSYSWKRPLAGHHYVIGVDVAEGKKNDRDKPDYSVATVLHWLTGEHVATLYCRLPDDEFAKELYDIGREYNSAFIAVERNGPGLAVIRVLQSLGYTNLYSSLHEESEIHGIKYTNEQLGWLTTGKTKPILLSEYNSALRGGDFSSPDAGLWDEMKSFGRDLKAKSSSHDDRIMSAAISWYARNRYRPNTANPSSLVIPSNSRSRGSWTNMWD